MENLSHSRQPSKSSATLSKKACNGASFVAKTTYDDVFGGPPKFGTPSLAPRVDDYGEIFGGFHASRAGSIPVLDLPVVEDEDVFFDVSSSGFDYDEVFGGYNGHDFAVSFEELMMEQANGVGGGDVDSSEEAWTPEETESLAEESDHSGKNQSLSNRYSYDSIDGSMEFNISYHKANQRSDEDMSNGITHVTQLHDVSGYAFLVNKTTPLGKTYNGNPSLQMIDDGDLQMGFSGRQKNLRKTMSQPSNRNSCEQTFENGCKTQKVYGRNASLPNETFVTISEINLRTQPSEVPPPCRPAPLLDVKKGDFSAGAINSRTVASEETTGDSSPPFFDVEVDASSSAAASAAAMKEAMEKAQARLKNAKELLERKRERRHSRKERKDKEGKVFSNFDGSDIKDERVHATYEIQENGMTFPVKEERPKVSKTTRAVPDLFEGQKPFNVDQTSEMCGRSDKLDGDDEWKEATQFFELVRTDRSKTFEQANSDDILVPNTKIHDLGPKVKKGASEGVEHLQVDDKKPKTNIEDLKGGEIGRKLKVTRAACEQPENNGRSEASKVARRHKGREKKEKAVQEVCEVGENEKKLRMARQSVENEKKPTADESEKPENLVEVQRKDKRFEHEKAMKHTKNEQLLKEANSSMENERRSNGALEREDDEKRQRAASKQEETDKKLKEALEQREKEKRLKEAREREESEKRVREALEQMENEKRLKEECEKKQREAFEQEENERRIRESHKQEENEKKQREASEREENEKRLTEAHELEAMGKRLEAVWEQGDNITRQVQETEECEIKLKETFEKEETGNISKEAGVETEDRLIEDGEAEDLKGLSRAHEQTRWDENGKKLKMADGSHVNVVEEELRASDKGCVLDNNENIQVAWLGQHELNSNRVQKNGAFADEGDGKIQTECRDSEMGSETVETEDVPVDEEFEVPGLAQGNSEREELRLKTEDVAEPLLQDHSLKRTVQSGTSTEETQNVFQMDSETKKQGTKIADEQGYKENYIREAQVGLNQKENKDKFMPTQPVESVQNGRKTEAAQPSHLEGKGNIHRTAQWVNASQTVERKEKNTNKTLTLEEKEAERMRRERELEMERLRKIEEEREREREREKDRMAVDLATLEARERAYAEARERAERTAVERATSEARQRALAEARERLEKACAEAKEKTFADRSSMEARLRAERAAVERATAEARERAVEKAMTERAAFETRERVDRTFSEKFSSSSRNGAMRPSSSSSDLQDQKFQSASSFPNSRYQYSSVYASYNTDRSEGVEGESAQRCKARLERHRRTAERAAKALAEKNMRDLLAQREQAERNRLAETLDADVKRWSSGKEGNLRALLSTLQYILGPDSGWHPIPLTEVITSAAVKKAYRKATLCVHPDKLQQRGASIQQKYICEKVFDLLKEAWNKFNSEER